MLAALLAPQLAAAQEEIPPPSGKGRLVVVLSGASGAGNYRAIAGRIAALGYDVALFDSNTIVAARKGRSLEGGLAGGRGAGPPAAACPAGQDRHGRVLARRRHGAWLRSSWSSDVAVVAAWYPSTRDIKDVPAFAGRIAVPVVMFAGTADEFRFCCMIDKAREIAKAAKAANAPFELTTYAGVRHGFTIPGTDYDPGSTDDALSRTAAALKRTSAVSPASPSPLSPHVRAQPLHCGGDRLVVDAIEAVVVRRAAGLGAVARRTAAVERDDIDLGRAGEQRFEAVGVGGRRDAAGILAVAQQQDRHLIWPGSPTLWALSLPMSTPEEITAASGRTDDLLGEHRHHRERAAAGTDDRHRRGDLACRRDDRCDVLAIGCAEAIAARAFRSLATSGTNTAYPAWRKRARVRTRWLA
jgi:dienelactone hydrolase